MITGYGNIPHCSGTGTEEDPWIVSDINGFLELIPRTDENVSTTSDTFYISLAGNIDFNDAPDDICNNCPTIKFPYNSTVNIYGNGYSIKNHYVENRENIYVDRSVNKRNKINIYNTNFENMINMRKDASSGSVLILHCGVFEKDSILYGHDAYYGAEFINCTLEIATNGMCNSDTDEYAGQYLFGCIFIESSVHLKHVGRYGIINSYRIYSPRVMKACYIINSNIYVDMIYDRYSLYNNNKGIAYIRLFSECNMNMSYISGILRMYNVQHSNIHVTLSENLHYYYKITRSIIDIDTSIISSHIESTKIIAEVKINEADCIGPSLVNVDKVNCVDNVNIDIEHTSPSSTIKFIDDSKFSDKQYLADIGYLYM
jgi:hypothetical protein